MTRLCGCGCGEPTPVAQKNVTRLGWIRGEQIRFIRGHSGRVRKCEVRLDAGKGRWYITARDGSRVLWYRIVAMDLLGRDLLPDEVVHHIDGDPSNDEPSNLQVMTRSEHGRLHNPPTETDEARRERRRVEQQRRRDVRAKDGPFCTECGFRGAVSKGMCNACYRRLKMPSKVGLLARAA